MVRWIDAAENADFSKWFLTFLSLILSGLGYVWLADWGGAHGPSFARGMAHQQAVGILLGILLACSVVVTRTAIGWAIIRNIVAVSVGRAVLLLTAAVVVVGGFLHWAHKLEQIPSLPHSLLGLARSLSVTLRSLGWQPVTPSLTTELLRWLACMILAWLLYRAVHARLPGRVQAIGAAGVLLALLLSLWLSRDKGPMLVLAVAWVCLAAAATRQWLVGRSISVAQASVGSLSVLMLGLGCIVAVLPLVAPADRVAAWRHPFDAKLEYLAEVIWFLRTAGWQGFGGGQTPWCGYLGAVVGHCQGLPVATGSDLTLVALAGMWGTPVACLIAAGISFCLIILIRLAGVPRAETGAVNVLTLLAGAGSLMALMTLAQWAVTVLGNVGIIPLTGVSLPYLSWGRTALLSLAVTTALVWPTTAAASSSSANTSSASLAQVWKHLAWVAQVFSAVALIALLAGFFNIYWMQAQDQTRTGRANPWLPLAACVESAQGQPITGVGGPCESATRVVAMPRDATLTAAINQLSRQQPLGEPWVQAGLVIPRRQPVRLTTDATLQVKADQLAACLTGNAPPNDCGFLPAPLVETFAQRYEGAAARSVSMVTLRLRDGAILAAAHERSPCSEAQMQGKIPSPGCSPTAARQRARPGRLAHQVFHADDMVGSTVKPLLAASLLASDSARWSVGAGERELRRALVRSDTGFFIDHLLCWQNTAPGSACPGLAQLQRELIEMGLSHPIPLWQPTAQIPALTLQGLRFSVPTWPPLAASPAVQARELAAAQACSQRPTEQRWRGCGGEHLAATLAPLWGQGTARSNLIAVATIYLRLAAAARGERLAPAPHLWQGHAPDGLATGMAPAHAQIILDALRDVPLLGTAASACRTVRGKAGCAGMGWAMKTGTSLFPQAGLTAAQRAAHCAAVYREGASRREDVACSLYPMKWSVLLEGSGQPEARLTVVLAERNWSRVNGHLDDADDQGANVAAQAAVFSHSSP